MCGKQEKEAGYSRYLLSHDKNAMTFKKQIMYIMKANTKIRSISAELDELYGKEGTQERETFRNEAYAYYTGENYRNSSQRGAYDTVRTCCKIGTNKSYISRVETGRTEPKVSTFFRIASAFGRSVELVPNQIS